MYSGWHCKKEKCSHTHLKTKKEILNHWEETEKEINTIEKSPDGKCVYCGEEEGKILIDNPNMDKLTRWLVCNTCKEIIENQQKLTFGSILNEREFGEKIGKEMIKEASDELYNLSQKTGKPIFCGGIDKNKGFSSIEYTGEKEK